MINIVPVVATGEKNKSFVGIKVANNQIEFHYPEAYSLDCSKDYKKDVFNILRTLRLANTRTKDSSSINSKFKEKDVYPIASYLYILNDYFENKRYVNKEKIYRFGQQGKIDWNKTMKRVPFISNGNIIFPTLISESSKQQDNLLTEIYAYCVYTSVEELGWYYGLTSSEYQPCDFNFSKGRYLAALKTAINKTFDDRKRTRLIHMKNIITGLDEKALNTNSLIRGVDSYEHVFEAMVDVAFGNVEYKKKFFPNAEWDLLEESEPKETSKLRPDTVIVKDRKVYILDSKFYRYGTTFRPSDLPETTSIEKQITYAEFAKKIGKAEYDEVYNAFILPFSKDENIKKHKYNKVFEFVGVAKANWPLNKDGDDKKVAAILIDLRYLIENYLKVKDKEVQSLMDLIEENIKGE